MAHQTTLNVSLTPELGAFVKAKVDSGRYQSASEVIREGLRLMEQRERDHESTLRDIRQRIDAGWEQAERGEGRDGDAVVRDLRKGLSERQGGRTKKRAG
jgi:antitoxin ParD1/3/4